jgi:hypothetical protein
VEVQNTNARDGDVMEIAEKAAEGRELVGIEDWIGCRLERVAVDFGIVGREVGAMAADSAEKDNPKVGNRDR